MLVVLQVVGVGVIEVSVLSVQMAGQVGLLSQHLQQRPDWVIEVEQVF